MKRIRYLTAALCAAVFLCGFTFPAFAAGEAWESVAPVTEQAETTAEPAVTPSPEPVPAEPAADETADPEPTAGAVAEAKPAVSLSADVPEPSVAPTVEDMEEDETTDGVDWEGLDDAGLNPLTPDGQGTVLDNATDDEGKEFFTVITADEAVFYLVIDRQKSSENVYFLNAVTVEDLMALAEDNGEALTPAVTTEPEPEPTAEPEPDPEPEQKVGVQIGTLLLALAVVAVGGGAGWYFRIYKPRQQRAAELEEEYEPEPDYESRYDGVDEWDGEPEDLDEEDDE